MYQPLAALLLFQGAAHCYAAVESAFDSAAGIVVAVQFRGFVGQQLGAEQLVGVGIGLVEPLLHRRQLCIAAAVVKKPGYYVV